MRRGFILGMTGLIVAFACDDAHKVGEDIGVGGGGRATGGQSGKGGGISIGATGAVGVGGTSGGSSAMGGAGAGGNGGSTAAIGGTNSNGGSSVGAAGNTLVGIGATAGAAGAAGGPSIVDETCTLPPVAFEFTVDDPSLYCYQPDFVAPRYACGGIRILTGEGQAVTNLGAKTNGMEVYTGEWPRCATCPNTRQAYDPAGQTQLTSEPKTGTWDGGFDIAGTCGISGSTCYANRCVQPGKFIAKYCVAPKGAWSTCNVGNPNYFFAETACVEVPFDFPTTEVVRGKITSAVFPASTGGAAGAGGTGGSAGTGESAGVAGNAGTAGSSL